MVATAAQVAVAALGFRAQVAAVAQQFRAKVTTAPVVQGTEGQKWQAVVAEVVARLVRRIHLQMWLGLAELVAVRP
jgi:hypothetical protein